MTTLLSTLIATQYNHVSDFILNAGEKAAKAFHLDQRVPLLASYIVRLTLDQLIREQIEELCLLYRSSTATEGEVEHIRFLFLCSAAVVASRRSTASQNFSTFLKKVLPQLFLSQSVNQLLTIEAPRSWFGTCSVESGSAVVVSALQSMGYALSNYKDKVCLQISPRRVSTIATLSTGILLKMVQKED